MNFRQPTNYIGNMTKKIGAAKQSLKNTSLTILIVSLDLPDADDWHVLAAVSKLRINLLP
jgi:hypothetical protein